MMIMQNIKVRKTELLERMRDNRDAHREAFLAALEGYRQHALAELNDRVKALGEGRIPDISIDILRPVDHTRDYDRVIGMLEMDVEEELVLSETDYAQYVNDDWSWKRQWRLSNSGYVSGGTTRRVSEYFEDA
jgi:hypothetical protein